MKSSSLLPLLRAGLASAALLLSVAQAQTTFDISLNTSALVGHASAPFYVDFQLNDGLGFGNANNSAILSLFNFGGGSAVAGTQSVFGGATGNLASTVQLTDSSAFNDFSQAFTPGAFLSFRVQLTNVFNAPTPDQFSFAILDRNFANLPTFAPGISDALVSIGLTGGPLIANSYAGNPSILPSGGGIGIGLPAASVTRVVAVPEPSTYGMIGAASLVGFVIWSRRRTQKTQRE